LLNFTGEEMKRLILISLCLTLIQGISYSQRIHFSKDSLVIKGYGSYEDIKDSLFIKNSGESDLIIDSIYTNKIYSYPVDVCTKDSTKRIYIIFDQEQSPIIISPQDSIKLIFYMPDLCPICDNASFFPFNDTLYVNSNSQDSNTNLLFISGNGMVDVKTDEIIPKEIALEQNYPNPFNPVTTIEYSIPASSIVSIKVYDVLGREIETLVNEEKLPGNYKVEFNGSNLASGIYFYKIQSGNFSMTKKLLLLK
jgi:hypothetical protein